MIRIYGFSNLYLDFMNLFIDITIRSGQISFVKLGGGYYLEGGTLIGFINNMLQEDNILTVNISGVVLFIW